MTAAGARSLRPVGLAGLAWGAVLLTGGPALFRSVQGRAPSSREQDAVVVLGLRHAAQGLAQIVVPYHLVRLYVAVDALHAASMVVIAGAAPVRRRAALVSAAVAVLSGTTCLLAGHR